MPAAKRRREPRGASRYLALDQIIAGNAFARAAAALADAATAASAHDLARARSLAAEADGHLGLAAWALNGMRYVPHVPPRSGQDGADQAVNAEAGGEDDTSSPSGAGSWQATL